MPGLKNSPPDLPLKIRPHHGLCTAFFRGEGYSGEFTENMGKVIAFLSENDPCIVITEGADAICEGCPNLAGGACSGEKSARYDKAVLEMCGFSCGTEISWKAFSDSVRENIILQGKLPQVCADCQWFYICENA